MSAFALRLLLILSLVFNVVASPWAMARMQHDGHTHGAAPVVASTQDARRDVATHDRAMMPEGASHDHAAMLQASVNDRAAMPDHNAAHGDSACCDGAMCQCGCIPLPAVAFLVVLTLDPQPSLPVDMSHATLAIAARASPPFRPPAV